GTIDLHFRATLGSTLAARTEERRVGKETRNTPPQTANDNVSITITAVANPLTITKQVSVVGGGAAMPGATLDYLVHVTNTSANPVNPVVITDNLNAAGAGALTYVTGTATMNNSPNGVSVAGNVITASYSATYGPLATGRTIDLHFRATLGSTLAAGTIVTNTGVVTWNTPPQTPNGTLSLTITAVANPLTITKQVSVVGGGAAVPG